MTMTFNLGDRVRVSAARDIEGVLVEHRRFLDGTERWQLEYWHDGAKRDTTVMERELEPFDAPARAPSKQFGGSAP